MAKCGLHCWAPTSARATFVLVVVAEVLSAGGDAWRDYGREMFVDYLLSMGCQECEQLYAGLPVQKFTISSQVFGCADVDVLLPSLHLLYEAKRRRLGGRIPGLFVDGGANIGRASARWFAAFGDVFSRQSALNATQVPCIICAGADASGDVGGGPVAARPTVAVVAVEPSANNFALLQRHAAELGWLHEGYLGLNAALGGETREAFLAHDNDFTIDELASVLFAESDERPRQRVQMITIDGVVQAAREAIPGLELLATNGSVAPPLGIFLLKLDIEGMEPTVLRSMVSSQFRVKFVTFEYAANVWQENLSVVVQDLFAAGYFCFIITPERLYPVSGPFWDVAYEIPMWSNLFCGLEADKDLASVVQLHSGAVGIWPMLPKAYLAGHVGDSEDVQKPRPLEEAQHLCTDLGEVCAGVTCDCPSGGCGLSPLPPSAFVDRIDSAPLMGLCTPRAGLGGLRPSPFDEVTFLRDLEAGDLFLSYRRAQAAAAKMVDGG